MALIPFAAAGAIMYMAGAGKRLAGPDETRQPGVDVLTGPGNLRNTDIAGIRLER
jgi:hypothetical protein